MRPVEYTLKILKIVYLKCIVENFLLMKFFCITEIGSPAFDEFISLLGEKIRLKGWDKYRGGLDVKGIALLLLLVSTLQHAIHIL